jgi:hypothetical protein
MLLDAEGRSVRRAIGFVRSYVRVTESEHTTTVCACDEIEIAEYDGCETNDLPPAAE